MLRIFSSSACPISCLSYDADQIFRRKDKDILQLNLLFTFFYARFSNQGNPSSPLFQIQQCKDKDTQQLNLFCSLSPRISEFSNTMQSLSSPRWFCIFHRDKIIYCLVFSFSPPSFLLSPILHFSHPPTCWQCLASCMACFADLQKSRPFWESQCQTSG